MMDRFSGGTPEGRARVIAQEPVGRMGTAEEIALAVLWLCSDLGAFTVGHAMVVDGGQTVGRYPIGSPWQRRWHAASTMSRALLRA